MKLPVIITNRGEVYNKFIHHKSTKQKLAQAMAKPLRTVLDYSSIGRKTFIVHPLPPLKLFNYTKSNENES